MIASIHEIITLHFMSLSDWFCMLPLFKPVFAIKLLILICNFKTNIFQLCYQIHANSLNKEYINPLGSEWPNTARCHFLEQPVC